LSNIEYEMELLASSSDPTDRDKALKYYQSRVVKQDNKITGKKPIMSWQRKTAAEIMKTEYPPLKYIIPGIIPEGLCMIVGSPKTGKTLLISHLCAAVSHGGFFMGSIECEQREVLFLALEDNERRLKDRMIKQGGLANDKLFIETPETWTGGIGALRSYLKEYPETGLVIIDTLFKFSPIEDSNEYGKTYKPIALIQEIAAETRIPIILIHHCRKGGNNNNGDGWTDESMGSQGLIAAVDTLILLQRKDGKNEGSMRIKGRDVEEKCYDLLFDRDICTWKLIGESEIVKGDPKAQAEILSLLENNPEGLKTSDIASMLGKKDNAISNTLKTLNDKGKATKTNSKWFITHIHNNSEMKKSENMNFTNSQSLRDNENVNSESELEIY